MKWVTAWSVALLLAAGSAGAQPPPPGYAPVPPLRQEIVPPLPGPRVVWQPGHWYGTGSATFGSTAITLLPGAWRALCRRTLDLGAPPGTMDLASGALGLTDSASLPVERLTAS